MMREDGQVKGDKKQVFKYSAESDLSVQLMDDLKKRVKETEDKVAYTNKTLPHIIFASF